MKRKRLFAAAVVSAWCAASANAGYRVVSVTMTDLGTLGGISADANDINNGGQIVGISTVRSGIERGFLYSGGVMIDVIGVPDSTPSAAYAINKRGVVVGFFTDRDGRQAYKWDSGVVTPLAEAPPLRLMTNSSAVAINDSDQIVGEMVQLDGGPGGLYIATLWTDPTNYFSLDPTWEAMGASTLATDVDETGRATGHDYRFDGAWLWKPFAPPHQRVPTILPIEGYITQETDIWGIHHEAGLVGRTWIFRREDGDERRRAIYWDGASVTPVFLGVLPGGRDSEAHDINSEAFIAGWSTRPVPGAQSAAAFLFHKSFGMYALPTGSKWGACMARALNDRKESGLIQVVGACFLPGSSRAIRWDVIVDWVP
ncbi:MAG TPA: hypothetical protein VFU13_20480 [Steroidobacteraceae bacterium]|nr:hypothetical protein [Steroidobacteraceae bacterium]